MMRKSVERSMAGEAARKIWHTSSSPVTLGAIFRILIYSLPQMRKELEQRVDEQLKESLQQLHDIEKKDLLEYREWSGSSKNDPSDQRNQVART
jgi:hypothetical protein